MYGQQNIKKLLQLLILGEKTHCRYIVAPAFNIWPKEFKR